jgi:hypothetical protein
MAYVRLALGLLLTVVVSLALLTSATQEAIRASGQETVALASGSVVALATPTFLERGKRYAFSWPGGGPPQTFTVRDVRTDGWILVEVAEENVDPAYVPLGSVPTRWLNAALATSIQEMRPLLY